MQAVFFDLDGTIIDSKAAIIRCINRTLGNYGLEGYVLDDFPWMIGVPLEELFGRRIREGGASVAPAKVVAEYKAYHNETFMQDTRVHEGIFDIFKSLKAKGTKLGIITLRSREMAYNVTRGLGLADYMDITIAGGEVPSNKPSAYPILHACERFGVHPMRSVMVGDSTIDIRCGKSAGAKTIGVLWGSDSENELRGAGADMIARSTTELKDMLEFLNTCIIAKS